MSTLRSTDVRHPLSVGSDAQLAELFDIYRLGAGIADRDEVLRRISIASRRSALHDDLLDPGRSVSFLWRGIRWWPLFQFDSSMGVRAEVTPVVLELVDTVPDWEIALWFVMPNSWLDNQRPINRLFTDGGAVLQAARADRFVAVG